MQASPGRDWWISWLPGRSPRLPETALAVPVADFRRAAPLAPGHSGGTAPVSHRTSLDTRPYVAAESRPAGPRGQALLARALLDLLLELLDHLGHRLAHPGELPVLDLDHAQVVGR